MDCHTRLGSCAHPSHREIMRRQTYRDLLAWQAAMDLVDDVYRAVQGFPKSELFALSLQMRKAAFSVPSNIAEGHGRFNLRDFRRFMREARGSLLELETQITGARRQGFISSNAEDALLVQTARVGQLLNGLIRSIARRLAYGERRTENGERFANSSIMRRKSPNR